VVKMAYHPRRLWFSLGRVSSNKKVLHIEANTLEGSRLQPAHPSGLAIITLKKFYMPIL